jgi:hypothetical protein
MSNLREITEEHIAKKMYSKYKMSNMWEYPSCYSYAYGPICSESATNFNTKNYNRRDNDLN